MFNISRKILALHGISCFGLWGFYCWLGIVFFFFSLCSEGYFWFLRLIVKLLHLLENEVSEPSYEGTILYE